MKYSRYVFASIFAFEMESYLHLMKESGKYIASNQSALRNLDNYLTQINLTEKVLVPETITAWLKTLNVGSSGIKQYFSHVHCFCKYLSSLGFVASSPERPKLKFEYVPYIFSDDEFEKMIAAADDFNIGRRLSRAAIIYPILLRILYGCGLRLGEGRTLRWQDVDLDNGILTIRDAKNAKERFVPMDASLTDILKLYRGMTRREGICTDYLFESKRKLGGPLKNNTFYMWFVEIMKSAGINYAKQKRTERGPCPHCLRHVFTKKSFLKSEYEGRSFEDTAPFLAAYLGHDSIQETEIYLRSDYSVYEQSHKRVSAAIGGLFPEVNFNEE